MKLEISYEELEGGKYVQATKHLIGQIHGTIENNGERRMLIVSGSYVECVIAMRELKKYVTK